MPQAFNLEPFGDRVILKRIDEDAEMKRGLLIPEIAQVKSSKGRVIAAGPNANVEPGDIVLFSKYGAMEITLDGEDYLLLRFDEIYLREKNSVLQP